MDLPRLLPRYVVYHAWYYVRPTGGGCWYPGPRPSTTRHECTCHSRALTLGTSRWAGRYLGRHDKLPIVFSTFTSFVTHRLHVAGPSQAIRVPSLVRESLGNKQAHTVDDAQDLPTRHQSTRTTVIDSSHGEYCSVRGRPQGLHHRAPQRRPCRHHRHVWFVPQQRQRATRPSPRLPCS